MTRIATYPSRKIILADMPEVKNFSSDFTYNFFTKDENISEISVDIPNGFYVSKESLANVTPIDTSRYDRFVARYVLLQWEPIALPSNSPNVTFEEENKTVILDNLGSIYSETDLTLDEFSILNFKDVNSDNKTKVFADILVSNEKFGLGISSSLDNNSLQEISKQLNDATPQNISLNFISEVINQPKNYGVSFFDDNGIEQIANSLVEELATVEVRSTINNRFIYDVVKSSIDNPNSFYGDELSPLASSLKTAQTRFRSTINPSIVAGKDYDFEVEKVIDYRVIGSNEEIPEAWKPSVFCTGYLIEKYKRSSDGSLTLIKTDSVETSSQGYYFDNHVKYGDKLQYAIYSVFVAQTFSTYPETGERIVVRFLIKSKPRFTTIECIEQIPPSIPSDFSISWDYEKEKPVLFWSMPLNPQRDIKFFKIYKRTSINDPFELISIYDFNDLISPPEYGFANHLVKKFSGPETFFIDYSFTKDSQQTIYSIVSVDARGISSNYTQQLGIRFNKTTNALDITQIAEIGAPIPYPNMTLDSSLFVETIKTSGARRAKIFFNPEYYDIFARQQDGKKHDLKLLTNSNNGKYILQFINVDLQQQQIVELKLNDNRIRANVVPKIQDVPNDPSRI